MVNQEHENLLRQKGKSQQNVKQWNAWRKQYPNIEHDLHNAKLGGLHLNDIDLSGAELSETDLRHANLCRVDLYAADLSGEVVGNPIAAANSLEAQEFSKQSVHAWAAAVKDSGTATAEQLAAATEVSLGQFAPDLAPPPDPQTNV